MGLVVDTLLVARSHIDQDHLQIGGCVAFQMKRNLLELLLVERVPCLGISNALDHFFLLFRCGEELPWEETLRALDAREWL